MKKQQLMDTTDTRWFLTWRDVEERLHCLSFCLMEAGIDSVLQGLAKQQQSHDPHTTVMGLSHDPHTTVMGLSHDPHTTAMGLSHDPHTTVMGLSHDPHTTAMGLPHTSTVNLLTSDTSRDWKLSNF